MKKIIYFIITVVFLITLNHFTHNGLRQIFLNILDQPLAQGYRYLAVARLRVVFLFRLETIIQESQNLLAENRRLAAENLKINELMRENEFLREELGVAKKRGFKLEMTRVFQFNTDGPYRTALIDKGAEQEIKAGEPVIFGGDILLGIVKEVYPRQALVYLTTDPRTALNVKIVDSLISGRTKGALEHGLSLELITNQEEIKEGQSVVTSGLDGLPSLLLVGRISSVQTKSGELFKTVKIDPEFNNLFLENVFILKND